MQTFTAPVTTTYKIECWGASGGNYIDDHSYLQGKGAYTSGEISFSKDLLLYIYVGQKGLRSRPSFNQPTNGTFNGGGGFVLMGYNADFNNSQGGGATDVRLQNGEWNTFNSLKSRIMVAAGGGSVVDDDNSRMPSYGGALKSRDYTDTYPSLLWTNAAQGATQTSGYKFGIGQDGCRAGAGGGYYGGCAILSNENNENGIRGSGGSSFISGYTGCDAIGESSTEDNIIHTGQPNHYSGYMFVHSVMINGGGSVMPSPSGGTETGHYGDGYCIISWISPSL
ncbi:glycine rich domain-containing protein [Segatella albensis]|uniref:glycine rich domain-containing protein n=1 Tax=Segatella albensis TaxID=77768 RepID=UPI000411A6FF|nr:glycine rich domain-containing protein [Segatella albensis]